MTQTLTPFGHIDTDRLPELCRTAGVKYSHEYGRWDLISDEIEHWKLNNNNQKKMNEAKWYKKKGWLPVREMNFWYAMSQCKFILSEALIYAQNKLFDAVGDPVYLPSYLAIIKGLDPEKRPYSYNSLMKEVEESEKRSKGFSR